MKTFKLWLEEHEQNHRKNTLMRRLGFEPHALDASALKLRDFNHNRIKDALGQMGFEPEDVQDLQNWIDENPDGTLQNLLDKIDDIDLADDAGGEGLPSQKAIIPKGQPQPQPEARPTPAMYSGGMPPNAG